MKKIFLLLSILLFAGMVHASFDMNYSFPVTKILKGGSVNITATIKQTAPLITVPTCASAGCGVIFKDYNGFVYAQIPNSTNFENDLNCNGSSCLLTSTCVATCTFTPTIFAVNQNSRLISACYYVDINVDVPSVCGRIQALHAYDTQAACVPPELGNFDLNNKTCVYKRFTNAFTNTDMNVRVDANLTLASNSRVYLNGSTIDYNYFQNTNPFQHKTIVSSGSKLFDYNVSNLRIFGLSDT